MNLNKYVFSVLAIGLLVPNISFAMHNDGQAERKEEAQQAEQKRAAQANSNDQIPWKKVALNAVAISAGFVTGRIIKKIGKQLARGATMSPVTAFANIALLAAPFLFAQEVDAYKTLTGIALWAGTEF